VTKDGENDVREVIRSISDKDYSAFLAEGQDRLRYQVEFAQAVIRNLLLVNGGAVLALLTALGNSSMRHDDRGMWWAFFWFGGGLTMALAAYFAAFYSQFFYYNGTMYQAWNAQRTAHDLEQAHDPMPQFKKGDLALSLGVGGATLSLLAFVVGSFVSLDALLSVSK
jgi:hypothetical protein